MKMVLEGGEERVGKQEVGKLPRRQEGLKVVSYYIHHELAHRRL